MILTKPSFLFHQSVDQATAPVLLDSPHSGFDWPLDFQPAAPRAAILTSCDLFVDELWSDAPASGASLLAAMFPRAYIDPNRAETDIDPQMIDGPWPDSILPEDYSRRGMGLIRRFALPGIPMEANPLSVSAVQHRIRQHYRPYRKALADALAHLGSQHKVTYHLNLHSMKSRGNEMNIDCGTPRPDVVVSDRLGTTAAPMIAAWLAARFRTAGLSVQINDPYRGGDLIGTFGQPSRGRHSVQIELNRALYLDEANGTRGPGFNALRNVLADVTRDFCAFTRELTGHVHNTAPIA
jgi:N-formylglutamate deformylase